MTQTQPKGYPINQVASEICFQLTQFLAHEARLLDTGAFEQWFALLDDAIVYEIPIRLAVTRNSPDEFPAGAYRMRDDLAMIRKRVERAMTGEDWSEAPPSRTVRSVGSVEVQAGDAAGTYVVHSAVIVYRERAVEEAWDLIPIRRIDTIRVLDNVCTLLSRKVILAETIVRTPNLGIFL